MTDLDRSSSAGAIAKLEREQLSASTGFLLARVGAEARRRWAEMLGLHDLTAHDFATLLMLDNYQGRSQQEISRMTGVDPRNAVAIFDRLTRRRLMDRNPDPADRRRRQLRLTPAGRRLLQRLRRDGEQLERDMLAGLDAHQQQHLHELLAALYTTLIHNA
jgi:MarR family transcriptional regulator, temperature-dependent positive regulator of motility